MAPDDEIKQEADGDPGTVLEDTAAHERTGFRVSESVDAGANADNSEGRYNELKHTGADNRR